VQALPTADCRTTHLSVGGWNIFGKIVPPASGVHPKTAQQLARHSTLSLTMDVDTHVDGRPGLPSLNEPARESQRAAGTDGRIAPPADDQNSVALNCAQDGNPVR
jgi:hypothetical protein